VVRAVTIVYGLTLSKLAARRHSATGVSDIVDSSAIQSVYISLKLSYLCAQAP
jgi:hypothetical protein